jgi:hypothetical protein
MSPSQLIPALLYHGSMHPLLSWLPVTLSTIGTMLALTAFAYQVHRARFNQSVDLLFRLEADFFGPAKRIQRAKACRDMQNGSFLEAEPVLDFFETMALLLRRKALDQEMVWHTFYYWIERYDAAAGAYIQQRQATDPLVWKDLSQLVVSLNRFNAKQLGRSARPLSSKDIQDFLVEEQTEAIL